MRLWLVIAAVNGAIAVLAGAFAVHGLSGRLAPALLSAFETGAHYQMYHALALGLAAFALRDARPGLHHRSAQWACRLFLTGIILFSGSLYLLALTGVHALGAITPLGGLTLVAGWVMLAIASWGLSQARG